MDGCSGSSCATAAVTTVAAVTSVAAVTAPVLLIVRLTSPEVLGLEGEVFIHHCHVTQTLVGSLEVPETAAAAAAVQE
jgi:hypothetical protein